MIKLPRANFKAKVVSIIVKYKFKEKSSSKYNPIRSKIINIKKISLVQVIIINQIPKNKKKRIKKLTLIKNCQNNKMMVNL